MCDRIKEPSEQSDPTDAFEAAMIERQRQKVTQATMILQSSGCADVNKQLTECLEQNDRDWRKCQVITQMLRECMNKQ